MPAVRLHELMNNLFLLIVVFLSVLLTLYSIYHYIKKRPIMTWKNAIKSEAKLFDQLYQSIDGYMLSTQARQGNNNTSLVYGEVMFHSFAAILSIVKPLPGEIFYDLGSGSGRAVIIAALLYDLKKSCGIELLKPLYDASCQAKQQLAQVSDPKISHKSELIEFYNDNFLQHNLSDAGIVFVNATSFFEEDWKNTVTKLLETKPGCRIILCTKKLAPPDFDLVKATMAEMSWGENSINIYRRL